MGASGSLTLACSWGSFLPLRFLCLILMWWFLLYYILLCFGSYFFKAYHSFPMRDRQEVDGGAGRSGGRENYNQGILYERRIYFQ